MGQEEGAIGRLVGAMIRRTVKARFRNVYWTEPSFPLVPPVVFVPNHHGWHDGYLMFHLVSRLKIPSLDWIAEYGAFPLFRFVGGLPFPADDALVRAATLRRTVRMMREQGRSLVLFAEGALHRPPELLPLGKALQAVAGQVPAASVVPVAILYDMSLHERPEAFLRIGRPVAAGPGLPERTREAIASELEGLRAEVAAGKTFEILAPGTPDVNERWAMRRAARR
jgi:1-acyl-sn-glycerol-3-phosphate acyltransferase